MGDATLADFEALAGAVNSGMHPILPQPAWGQDAAFIAFVIDDLRAIVERFADVARLIERLSGHIEHQRTGIRNALLDVHDQDGFIYRVQSMADSETTDMILAEAAPWRVE